MEKTAGSMLADLLRAKDEGATKEEIVKKELELAKQSKKQLSHPSAKVNVSVNGH